MLSNVKLRHFVNILHVAVSFKMFLRTMFSEFLDSLYFPSRTQISERDILSIIAPQKYNCFL